MSTIISPAIEEAFGFKLAKASGRFFELFQSHLIQAGISSKHYGVMLTVYEYPFLTQRDVAEIQRTDRTTMGQLIDQLEEKSLLRRIKHPTDRRAYCLALTQKGEDLVSSLWVEMKSCEAVFTQNLKEYEIKQLFTLIDKIEK